MRAIFRQCTVGSRGFKEGASQLSLSDDAVCDVFRDPADRYK
jgi:hypothetical protein